jgi:hypothetical protein
MTYPRKDHALGRDELVSALGSGTRYTTADGNAGGTTLFDANLIGSNNFLSAPIPKAIQILSGPAIYEISQVSAFNNATGQITLSSAFSAQITSGTIYRPLNGGAGLTGAQATQLTAIKAQTDKLAGQAPVVGTATENWNAAEANVASFGAAGVSYLVNDFSLSIHNLVGTIITVRTYKFINGVERKVYEQEFDATTDPPGIDVITGIVAIHDVMRVTLQSNDAGDNGEAVDFDYMLEEQ